MITKHRIVIEFEVVEDKGRYTTDQVVESMRRQLKDSIVPQVNRYIPVTITKYGIEEVKGEADGSNQEQGDVNTAQRTGST